MFISSKHANLNECKIKTKYKHCHVGLLEITPSISEKRACSRTEEEIINKITKRGKRLEKDKKLHYRWSMLRNSQISYGKEIARRPATSNEQVIATRAFRHNCKNIFALSIVTVAYSLHALF